MHAETRITAAKAMIDRYPSTLKVDAAALTLTIDALNDCVQTCTADADADLREQHVADLAKCVRLCLDCADICAATARVITRQSTEFDSDAVAPLLEACATMCRISGDECQRHAHLHEHCRLCAEVCRGCEQACRDHLASIAAEQREFTNQMEVTR